MCDIPAIDVSSFYNRTSVNKRKRIPENSTKPTNNFTPYKMTRLVDGPSLTWKIFRKQAEALHFASVHKDQVMTFAFETTSGRSFLVAHPEVFWFHDCQKFPQYRSTYEIIPENTACKLYFDIEFDKSLNPFKDGSKMVIDFISIVNFFLEEKFQVCSSIHDVLILDSTSDIKFSSHLIFNTPDICFGSNKHAGNFVEFVCDQILLIIEKKELPNGLKGVSVEDCCELHVQNKKEVSSLFSDRSVYSRNRHFRLYMSSKLGKGVPLLVSAINKFTPLKTDNYEQDIFFSSLITYLPGNYEDMNVINFDYHINQKCESITSEDKKIRPTRNSDSDVTPSPFKDINDFINGIVYPGKIYRSCYFLSRNLINYDIVGNRFCGNIGRPHKSNNVKYVVDLKERVYYQKCHDFFCKEYKSEKKPLPENLLEAHNTGENYKVGSFTETEKSPRESSLKKFPSCGLSDEDILDCLNKSDIVI